MNQSFPAIELAVRGHLESGCSCTAVYAGFGKNVFFVSRDGPPQWLDDPFSFHDFYWEDEVRIELPKIQALLLPLCGFYVENTPYSVYEMKGRTSVVDYCRIAWDYLSPESEIPGVCCLRLSPGNSQKVVESVAMPSKSGELRAPDLAPEHEEPWHLVTKLIGPWSKSEWRLAREQAKLPWSHYGFQGVLFEIDSGVYWGGIPNSELRANFEPKNEYSTKVDFPQIEETIFNSRIPSKTEIVRVLWKFDGENSSQIFSEIEQILLQDLRLSFVSFRKTSTQKLADTVEHLIWENCRTRTEIADFLCNRGPFLNLKTQPIFGFSRGQIMEMISKHSNEADFDFYLDATRQFAFWPDFEIEGYLEYDLNERIFVLQLPFVVFDFSTFPLEMIKRFAEGLAWSQKPEEFWTGIGVEPYFTGDWQSLSWNYSELRPQGDWHYPNKVCVTLRDWSSGAVEVVEMYC